MTLMHFVSSNITVIYYEWIVLLDFVTVLPNMLETFTKGIDTKDWGFDKIFI
jgi:hypothetical protein